MEDLDLDSLIGAEYNPRSISTTDFNNLYESIGRFGDMSGFVWNRRTKRVVGGHQRKEAYKKHGGKIEITERLDEPNEVGTVARGYVVIGTEKFVYRIVDWDETKEKLANLAANKIQGDWDDDKLAELIYSLRNETDLPDAGFSTNEVAEILATVSGVEDDEDADLTLSAEEKVKVKLGDLYQLGEHRLLCGDATIATNYEHLMGGVRAEMVFTDPPYNVGYDGGTSNKTNRRRKILNDKMDGEKFFEFLNSVCKNMLENTRGAFYIAMSSNELHSLFRAFTENGGHWQTYIIWVKDQFTLSRTDYHRQYEPILYGLSEEEAEAFDTDPEKNPDALPILYGWNEHHSWYGGRKQGNAWLIEKPAKSPHHPTEKPISLCARAIRNSSKRDDVVLEPFCGSGSTLIASEQLQRRCYAMELEPIYIDVIIRRWEQLTGKKAKLIKNVGGE